MTAPSGQALKRNPFPLSVFDGAPPAHMVPAPHGSHTDAHTCQVPCHRVVAANMTLGGFSGDTGIHTANIRKKIALLRAEGVALEEDAAKGVVRVRAVPYVIPDLPTKPPKA